MLYDPELRKHEDSKSQASLGNTVRYFKVKTTPPQGKENFTYMSVNYKYAERKNYLKHFYFLNMVCGCFVCMCVCLCTSAWCSRSPEENIRSPETGLCVGAGNWTQALWRSGQCSSPLSPSVQSTSNFNSTYTDGSWGYGHLLGSIR